MKNTIIQLLLQTIVIIIFSINSNGNINPILNDAIALKSSKDFKANSEDVEKSLKLNIDDSLFRSEILGILIKYSTHTSEKGIIFDFSNEKNPFIDLGDYQTNLTERTGETSKKPTFSKSLSSFNVSNLAFGITDFLIDRTKTELNIAFFNQFKKEINKEEYNDLRILFPETAKILMVIGDQMYYYNNYIQSLRNAFETDLNRMPDQIRKWIELNKTNIDDSVYKAIQVGLITTTSIIEQKHPGAILDHLSKELKSKEKDDDKVFNTFKNTVYLSALISESFRDTLGSDDYWVNQSKINELYKDKVLLRIYLGLLYQQIKLDSSNLEIYFDENLTLLGVLDSIGKNWKDNSYIAESLVNNVSTQIKMTQNSVTQFKEIKKSVNANDKITNRERNKAMFNAYFDLTSSLLDIVKKMGLGLKDLRVKQDTNFIKQIRLIYSDSIVKKIDSVYLGKIEDITKVRIYTLNKQYVGAISQAYLLMNSLLDKKENDKKQWQTFLKYGTFMANMVTADTPEEITDAIEAVASPPGSYSIKNNSKFSVALNGYLGLFGGGEFIKDNKTAWNFSITAPIGLSFNWKCNSKIQIPTGVFISVFDLGVIASYRLSDNQEISILPKVKLNNIISPGIFIEQRLGSSPLTLGFGGQISPQIREQITKDDMGNITERELITEELYKRMGITLKVDIPILYLKQ
jgi:hypothetical protein